jgi:hypothetical protein
MVSIALCRRRPIWSATFKKKEEEKKMHSDCPKCRPIPDNDDNIKPQRNENMKKKVETK